MKELKFNELQNINGGTLTRKDVIDMYDSLGGLISGFKNSKRK